MLEDESSETFYEIISDRIDSLFTRPSKFKFGERGREWSWRWGYWGRALSHYYRATNSALALQQFNQIHARFRELRDDELGLTDDLRGTVMKSWGTRLSGRKDKGLRSCEVESTGLLLLPYTDLILRSGDRLPREMKEAMTDTICHGLDAHIDEFIEHPPSNGGYFVSRWNGSIEPLNHSHLYAAVAAEAYAITGNDTYRTISEKVYNFFKYNWHTEENETISWAYAPSPDNRNIEHPKCSFGERSFNHVKGAELFFKAAVTIELPLAMYRAGILDKEDLSLISFSLRKNVLRDGDSMNMYISPRKYVPDSVAHLQKQKIRPDFICVYYLLMPFDPQMKYALDDLLNRRDDWFPSGLQGGPSRLLAYAFLHFDDV